MTERTSDLQGYLSIQDACKYLGCSRATIYREINAGRLRPAGRVGTQFRFTVTMLDQYVANQCCEHPERDEGRFNTNSPASSAGSLAVRNRPRRRHKFSPQTQEALSRARKILGLKL